jgi:pimeloyl-ACP methyl ester carboxylesterase
LRGWPSSTRPSCPLKSLEEAREYGDPLSTTEGAQAFVRWLSQTLAPAELDRFAAQLRHRLDAGVAFPVPLLLLYATQDPLVNPAMGDTLHQLVPSATLVRLDCRHFCGYSPISGVTQRRGH